MVKLCMNILINAKLKTGKEVKKQSWLGEVHYEGEGPQWTVVPSKKKKKRRKKKNRRKKVEHAQSEKTYWKMNSVNLSAASYTS